LHHKSLITAVVFLAASITCIGQTRFEIEKDSFQLVLRSIPNDSNKVMTLLKFGWWWETYNMDSAANCYVRLGELSRKINYTEGQLKYYANYTFILNHKGKFDESLKLNKESVEFAKKKGTKIQLANCLFNTGSSYNNMSQYDEAIVYYLQAAKVFEDLGLANNLAIAYGNIGGVFINITQYGKGLDYSLKALAKAREAKNVNQEATFLINAGICATHLNQLENADEYLNQGLTIAKNSKSSLIEMQAYNFLAELYTLKKEFSKSIDYARLGLKAARDVGSLYNEMDALKALTIAHSFMENPSQTIKSAEEAIAFCKKNDLKSNLDQIYLALANANSALGNYKAGFQNLMISHNIEDSVNQKEVTEKIEQLEILYQTAQKEKQILELKHEQENQNLFITGLILILLILTIIGFLIYSNLQGRRRNTEQKHRLIETEISQLKQAQQLLAAESILKGEEEERSRLAKDLHDGLGGMLWGVKTSLSTMKGNMILQGDQVQTFERSLDMLNNSITELRRVAHNLMPEALVKFGLTEALKDFCDFINNAKIMNVIFQQVGIERRFDTSSEVILYRIANELANNAMRHSSANELIVQLHYDENVITLTVEDNGIGFDETILQKTTGAGWPNIKSRVEYLKGTLDVETSRGKGTAINITIPT